VNQLPVDVDVDVDVIRVSEFLGKNVRRPSSNSTNIVERETRDVL
jgi:hypothetical protein